MANKPARKQRRWRSIPVTIKVGFSEADYVAQQIRGSTTRGLVGLAVTPAKNGGGFVVTHLASGYQVAPMDMLPVALPLAAARQLALRLAKLGSWERTGKEILADLPFRKRAKAIVLAAWDADKRRMLRRLPHRGAR